VKNANSKNSKRVIDRRGILLSRLGLTSEQVDSANRVTPLFQRIGIKPERVIEVLAGDTDEDSCRMVALWGKLTPANRHLLKLEGLALACSLTPRRLWELYNGANMTQSQECVGAMICEALPGVMKKTVKQAMQGKIHAQEHLYKAARVLPTPKGSVINIGTFGTGEENDDDEPEGRMLEGADAFLMKASRAMGAKALPTPAIEVEPDEDEEEED
jgi:hypothetical protein